ncbi:MAG: hypothetical protein AAF721_11515 [Myxococcota bacterium]
MIAGLVVLGLGACDGPAESSPADAKASAPAAPVVPDSLQDDEARAKRYAQIADRLEADPKAAIAGKTFAAFRADLQSIADRAEDRFLRINASILLGHMLDLRGDTKGAIAYWRHATQLVPAEAGPDDAGPFMALALGLAGDKQFKEAAEAQAKAAALDPNNLENWLALGELRIRAGDKDAAATAYVDYERVRASLVDGLTGRQKADGAFFVSADERIACAQNLSAAVDAGTAMVLLYSLSTEPEARVRQAVAEVMGQQRLKAYAPRLTEMIKTEADNDAKTAMQWALTEIDRDPVLVTEGEAASLPKDDPRAADGKPRAALPVPTGKAPAVPASPDPSAPQPPSPTEGPTAAPTKTPTKAPTKAPTGAAPTPSPAPAGTPKHKTSAGEAAGGGSAAPH